MDRLRFARVVRIILNRLRRQFVFRKIQLSGKHGELVVFFRIDMNHKCAFFHGFTTWMIMRIGSFYRYGRFVSQ